MRFRRVKWLALAVTGLVVVPLVSAEEKWQLRLTLGAGEPHRFAMSQTQNMDIDLGAAGRQHVVNRSRLEYTQTLEKTLSDGSLRMDMRFDRIVTSMDLGGMKMEFDTRNAEETTHPAALVQRALVGKQFTVTLTPRGQVSEMDGVETMFDQLADVVANEPGTREMVDAMKQGFGEQTIASMLQQSILILPENPVGVGDTWQQELTMPNPVLGSVNVASDYRLEASETVDELDCLRIAVESAIEIAGEGEPFGALGRLLGSNVDLDVSSAAGAGTIWVDRATGLVVRFRMTQKLETNMRVTRPDGGETGAAPLDVHSVVNQQIDLDRM